MAIMKTFPVNRAMAGNINFLHPFHIDWYFPPGIHIYRSGLEKYRTIHTLKSMWRLRVGDPDFAGGALPRSDGKPPVGY